MLITHDLGVVAGLADQRDGDVRRPPGRDRRPPTRSSTRPGTRTRSACWRRCPASTTTATSRSCRSAAHPPSLIHLPSGCAFHPRCDFAQDRLLRRRGAGAAPRRRRRTTSRRATTPRSSRDVDVHELRDGTWSDRRDASPTDADVDGAAAEPRPTAPLLSVARPGQGVPGPRRRARPRRRPRCRPCRGVSFDVDARARPSASSASPAAASRPPAG